MYARRSLKLPITLAVVMIVLLIALTVGWVLLSVANALRGDSPAVVYWVVLPLGTTFLVLVLVGVVVYLTLSIKAINLTRRQSNFIDSVTHELKSPIASLKLYLQTLALRQVSEQQQESFCRFMLEDVDRLDHLINHVLDAGKLDREVVEDEYQHVSMADLLRECVRTISLRYRIAPEVIVCDLHDCTLQARRVDLEIVFRNLIDNAVKYAAAEPRVMVGLRLDSAQNVVVTIRDNGRGIPQNLRRKIFGRFVRLGLELERKQPGLGLGLHLVRTLVKSMRGRVRVYDPDDRVGTVFGVTLPGGQPARIAAEPPADSPPSNPGQPLRVEAVP